MKKLIFFGLVNVLTLAGCILASMAAYAMANRYFARDVVFIAPRLNESHLHWNASQLDFLQEFFWSYSFSAESRGNVLIETANHQVSTTVVYTDTAYFQIHFMAFIEGNHWQGDGARAIVLNEALAWRLFGSADVTGLTVTINQFPHVVAGVVRQDPHGLGEFLAWMPRSASPTLLPITALYLHAHNYNTVDIGVETRQMLTFQLRNPDDYAIVDINRYVEAIGLRNRIFIYVLWLYVLVLLAQVWARKPKRLKLRPVLGLILPTAGILLASYVLFTGVNGMLYWLPNIGAPQVSVFQSITNMGVLPPDGYLSFGLLRLSRFNHIGLLSWIVGAVALVNIMVTVAILTGKE